MIKYSLVGNVFLLSLIVCVFSVQQVRVMEATKKWREAELQLEIMHLNFEDCDEYLTRQSAALEALRIDTDAVVANYNRMLANQQRQLDTIRKKVAIDGSPENVLAIVADTQQDLLQGIITSFR